MKQTFTSNQTHFIASGRFTFSENNLLGQGSTGSVYKGYDYQENRSVAIKVIDTGKMNQVEKSLIENEKRALRMLKHNNIMKLISIDEQSTITFIVSELYQNGSLKDYLEAKGKFSQQQAMQFFRKIIDGYCAIVEANIIHRDLKPTNILMNTKNEPVIIDFGYSQIIVANRNLTVFNVGSPSYMSPEAYTKTIYSEKSDVWSLGAIFYELITNVTLDNNCPTKQYFDGLKNVQYPPIDFDIFSEVVQEILKGTLAAKPQQRITTHRIKYLLDKEILGKKFSAKMVKTDSSQANELRASIPNSTSVKNFQFYMKQNDFSQPKQQEQLNMKKKPSTLKSFSSTPSSFHHDSFTSKNLPHSPAESFINQLTKKQSDQQHVPQKQTQTATEFNRCVSGSLNITPSVSRIEYVPAYQYQSTVSNLNYGNYSNQTLSSNKIQMNDQRQANLNTHTLNNDYFNQSGQDRKCSTHNEGFYSRKTNENLFPLRSSMQKHNQRQPTSYFPQTNQVKQNQPQRYEVGGSLRAQDSVINQFSMTPQKYYGTTQKVCQNENMRTQLPINHNNPINLKQLSQQIQAKISTNQHPAWCATNNSLKQRNQYIDHAPQPYHQPQKLYQSEQNSPYQRANFQNVLRASTGPQNQFGINDRTANYNAYNNSNSYHQTMQNQHTMGSIRNSTGANMTMKNIIGLRKIV